MSKLSKKDRLRGQIREKVRSDYAGIISEAQIDATSKYWTDFLHSLFQKKEREIYNKRRNSIVMDYLMPKATLASVGEAWGITRERVRQIFKEVTGKSTRVAKKYLIDDSNNFRCAMCGEPLSLKSKNIYCSKSCYALSVKYDLKVLKVCKFCNEPFYPLRNWRIIGKTSKCITGQYCSMKHYMLSGKLHGRDFSKESLSYRNITNSGEKK